MAKAIKCDICGAYYDFYEHMTAKEVMETTPNRIQFGTNFIDNYGEPNFVRHRPPKKSLLFKFKKQIAVYDICPACFEDIVDALIEIKNPTHLSDVQLYGSENQ